jgi:hypothetical protein
MNIRKYILFTLVLLVTSDSLKSIANSGFSEAYFTPISLFAAYISLFLLYKVAKKSDWNSDIPVSISIIYKLVLIWNIVTIAHGAFTASGYWDWKFLLLASSLFLLIPLAFFMGKNISFLRLILYYILNYLLVFGFLLLPLTFTTNEELYSRIMVPVTFLLVFIPYIDKRHQYLVLLVSAVSILVILDFRTNIIKIAIGVLITATYYFRRFFGIFWIKAAHLTIFVLPVILFFLALTNQYNVFTAFSESAQYTVKTRQFEQSNLTADTRTFLYVEVLSTIQKSGTLIFGGGATAKYRTEYFENLVTGSMRFGTEVGFLNMLLYSGIFGVVLYFLILFMSSYYAIYKSNNWLCKMLGVLIASRWIIFFLEEFTAFDLNFYLLWIMIGLVSSTQFRMMTDREIKEFCSLRKKRKNPMRFNNVPVHKVL